MGELDWLLDNLVSSVLGVRIAVILSPDGLMLAKSPGVSQSEGDHLAALAAGAASLARGVGMWSGYGDVSQTIIEMDVALLFITPAGRGTCLALLADAGADAGPTRPDRLRDGRPRQTGRTAHDREPEVPRAGPGLQVRPGP